MNKPIRKTLMALMACATALTAAPALAEFEGQTADDVVQVSFMPGWRLPNGNHMAAIHIALAPGWKTYWRAPGEGGVPTVLRLTEAEGITGMRESNWPARSVLHQRDAVDSGIGDDVVLPVWTFRAGRDRTRRIHGPAASDCVDMGAVPR